MRFECKKPPCLHVVYDKRLKQFAVFFEDSQGNIVWIEKEKVVDAAENIKDMEAKGFKEAKGNHIDRLASRYLEASPVSEDWGENP